MSDNPYSKHDRKDETSPRRYRWGAAVFLAIAAAGAAWSLRPAEKSPETRERVLFRTQLPGWTIARAKGPATSSHEDCLRAAEPWPALHAAIDALPQTWGDEAQMTAAVHQLNVATREAGLSFWVDPQFLRQGPVFMTYEVLARAQWKGGPKDQTVEAIHVRRLDTLNLELGVVGHASGDQPSVLRDRLELAVMRRLRTVDEEDRRANEVDQAAAVLWKQALIGLVPTEGLDEAQRRLDRREQLARDMERRLKGGKIQVARPERMIWGDAYFDFLEPYTSAKRRGGPLLLSSDLRALRRADEALDDSTGLAALIHAIDLEAALVEAHEVTHALDPAPREVPELLQHLVGDDDGRFGHLAERELRAFLGELRDGKAPACLGVVSLGVDARGSGASSTPHFFAAHALLSTLGDVDGRRGLDASTTVKIMRELCSLPDPELRTRAHEAAITLYGAPLEPQQRLPDPAPTTTDP